MIRFKDIAERAVKTLIDEMIDHGEFPANWKTIDRIQRRFSIQGCAETFFQRWKEEKQKQEDSELARQTQYDDNAFYRIPPEKLAYIAKLRPVKVD